MCMKIILQKLYAFLVISNAAALVSLVLIQLDFF